MGIYMTSEKYIVYEFVGRELIDEFECDSKEEAIIFAKEHNALIDNSFATPENQHFFMVKDL